MSAGNTTPAKPADAGTVQHGTAREPSPPTPSGAATLDVEELQRSARQLDVTLSTMAAIVSVPQSLWDDHCNAALKLIAALPALLSRAEEADRLDLELADAKAGYLRRHNEATDHFERAIEAETKLAASEAQAEALREALKAAEKFVPTYEPWMDAWADADLCGTYRQGGTYGDLRRVRALSSEAPNG